MKKTILNSTRWSVLTLTLALLAAIGTGNALGSQLNWDAVSWPNNSLSNSYAIGGGNVTLVMTGQTGRLSGSYPNLDNGTTGGLTPAQNSVALNCDFNSQTVIGQEEITTIISFSHAGGVSNVTFSLFDIDTGSFTDQLIVTAFNGVNINPSSVTHGSANSFNGTNKVTGIAANGGTSSNGNANFTFNQGGITKVVIVYQSGQLGDPGTQQVNIHDINFAATTNTPTCSVTGTNAACPNASGLVFTETTSALIPSFAWTVTGNGTIPGVTTNSTVSVNATGVGSFTIKCTVTDLDNGKTNFCSKVVTLSDAIAPTITTCATNQFGTANASCQAAVPNMTNGVVASDNCGAVTISQVPAIGTLVGAGTNTVTIRAVDTAANTNTCTASFIVRDTTVPSITTCATNQFGTANASCQATVPSMTNGVVASDNCSAVTLSQVPVVGTLVGIGTNTVTIRAVDASANTNTCTASFIVRDTTVPSITTCATNQFGNANASCQAAIPSMTNGVVASDNCSAVTLSQVPVVGTLAALGTNTVTIRAVDASANTNTCTASFIVRDVTAPSITTCATNQFGTANASCQAAVPSMTNGVVATDSCGAVAITQVPTIGTLVGSGTNTVTIRAVDTAGNTNTCTASFIVRDTTVPSITTCATNQFGTANASCQAAVPSMTNGVVATDNCSAVTLSQVPVVGTLVGLGTNTVTIRAVDASANTNTCTASFIVRDTTAPSITTCATNQSASAGGGGTAAVPNFTAGVVASDACGGVAVTQNPVVGTPQAIGPHTITIIAVDGSANSNTCTATFIVNDTTPPNIATCATNQSAQAGAGCQASTPNFMSSVIASDNSGVAPTITQNPVVGTLANYGTNNILIIAADGSGNSATCTAKFVVLDTTAPNISQCPAAVIANTDLGTNFASNVSLGAAPIASDLCGIGSITSNAPAHFPVGSNTVTWTVTDTHGNPTTCQQSVVVLDNQAPTITCPADVITNLAASQCTMTNVTLGAPVTADNVAVASVSSNVPAIYNIGTTQVVWTVTDTSGNSAICTQSVTLVDVTAPNISQLPANQSGEAVANCQAPVPDFTGGVIASDDCSTNVTVAQSPTAGTQAGLGTNNVDLIVTDASGNSTTGTVAFIVTDTTAPNISQCAPDQQGTAGLAGTAAVPDFTGGVVATDNCGGGFTVTQSPIVGAQAGIGANTITLTVTDASGNSNTCTATFTVVDTTAPIISQCAVDQSAEATNGCQATVPDFTAGVSASDNSGVAPIITQVPLAGTSASFGTNAVTLTATDGSSNFSQCTANFIVADTTAPSISQCAADVIVSTDDGTNVASNVDLGAAPLASDICGIANTTNNATVSYPFGTNVVTWTVTDTHGNAATCQQQVIVADNEPPAITCPVDISTNLPAAQCSFTNLDLGTPVTSDNVGVASVSSNVPASYDVGTNVVEWTATDFGGNTAICTQFVVVLDVTAPSINTLPSDQSGSAGTDCQAAVPDITGGVSASDDCTGSVTVTQSPIAGTLAGLGTNTITVIAADASGNTATGTVNFIVADTTAPNITQCAADQSGSSGGGTVAVPDFTGDVTATDNCSGSLAVTQSPTAGTLVGAGTHPITLTVTDDAGNPSQCTANFVVDDTTPPQITTCAGNQSASAGASCQAAVTDFTSGVVATDNSGVAPTITQSPVAGALVGLGTNTVTLTATDVAGNFVQCTASLIVADTTAPVITCPSNVTVAAAAGSNSVSGVNLGTPVTSDNCGSVTVTNNAPASFPLGDTIVTWAADDGNGNTSTCQQTVTVTAGNQPPVANNGSFDASSDGELDIAAPGVLAFASDADNDTMTAIKISDPTHGTLALNADGSFTYTPEFGFEGTDTFTYAVSDGFSQSGNATITIIVSASAGASDVDLYAKSMSFTINRAKSGYDSFKIKGKINPRGSKVDLTGATMQISVNGTNAFVPVALDSKGRGTLTVGSTKVKASLSATTGRYSFTISRADLAQLFGLPNVTGNSLSQDEVVLIITFADLQVTPIIATLETPVKTTADKTSKGRFIFKKNRTLTGVFNINKTWATQAKDGTFKVSGGGVIENAGGSNVQPLAPVALHIGSNTLVIPGTSVKAKLVGSKRQFKFNASGLNATGIPATGTNAPTVYELPITLDVPTGSGTNVFESIIELKRKDGTSTKWKR